MNKSLMKKFTFNVGALALAVTSAYTFAQTSVIYAGSLLTDADKKVLTKQTIVIENGVIKAVRAGYQPAANYGEDATIIDLKDAFVMPGMFDMHVHFQGELGPRNDSEKLRYSSGDNLMRSAHFAKKTLIAGFTTVRDLGGGAEESFALRDGIKRGWVEGPRIIAAGTMVAVTGGHGDVDGMSPDLLATHTAKTICDGPYDCRRATRHAIKYGADVIKITSTGGVLSDTDTGTGQQMVNDELREVIDAAHALGRKVTSHAHSATGINAALKAGVDSIEHGSYADEESIKLFKEHGAYLVPTLMAGDTVVTMAKQGKISSEVISKKAIRVGGDMIANFKRSYKSGVKIAYGTDSGVSQHGNNAYEAELMFNAGMKPIEIIKTATKNAADLAGKTKQLGTLEAGKYADIIAMPNNPVKDIKALQKVSFVMKGGKVYKQ